MCWLHGEEDWRSVGFIGFGSWFFWLFGDVHGKRRTDGFLKAKFHPFKISSSIFWEHYIVGVKCSKKGLKVFLLDFVDKIMHQSLRAW